MKMIITMFKGAIIGACAGVAFSDYFTTIQTIAIGALIVSFAEYMKGE